MLRQQEILELSKQNLKPTNRSAATSASGLIQGLALLRIRPRLKVVLPGLFKSGRCRNNYRDAERNLFVS